MTPLISVIIPVYNVEKYLRECLDSVINQTYGNLEIICIDDCSTDFSLEILKEFAKKDRRIEILTSQKNSGAGLTRNRGIEAASGDYIHFLDPDDRLDLETYTTLINRAAIAGEIEIINFDNIYCNEKNGKIEMDNHYKNAPNYVTNIYKNPDILDFWSSGSCNKLINAKFLKSNNIFFNSHRTHEDVEFTFKLILSADKILFIQDKLYYYRMHRKNSITENRIFYLDDMIKDTEWMKLYTCNLPAKVLLKVKNSMYEILIVNALDAFWFGTINFLKLKEIVLNNIEPEILKNNYYKKMYYDIKNSSRFGFEISYKIKRMTKEKFPEQWNLYKDIKHKFAGIKL